MEHTIVYTTAHVFEVDTVREAFRKADIPFYVQSESLAGVRAAFEAWPAVGLGKRWHIFVPVAAEVKARKTLSTLHLSTMSDSRPFFAVDQSTLRKNVLRALVLLSPVIAILGYVVYRSLTNH
jgi:hypothetical protein